MRKLGRQIIWLWLFSLCVAALPARAAPQFLQDIPGLPPAPDFTLPDIEGTATTLSDLRGQVVIVNFWATWCPPCRYEIPSMQRAWDILKDQGVMMLAVHVGGNEHRIWTFLGDFNVKFPVLVDASSRVSREFGTVGLPTTVIVDPEGRMALKAIGGREWDDPALLDRILALKTSP